MDVSVVKEFLAGKTDSEDVPVVFFSIRQHDVFVCIVEYHVTCLFRIFGHDDLAVWIVGSEADVCFHTSILDGDAVAMLLKLPDVVGQVSSDCAIYTLVLMVWAEGSGNCLIHETTLVVCGFVAVVSDDAIVTVAIRKSIRSHAVANDRKQRVNFRLHCIDSRHIKSFCYWIEIGILEEFVIVSVKLVEDRQELCISFCIAALTWVCSEINHITEFVTYVSAIGIVQIGNVHRNEQLLCWWFKRPHVCRFIAVAGIEVESAICIDNVVCPKSAACISPAAFAISGVAGTDGNLAFFVHEGHLPFPVITVVTAVLTVFTSSRFQQSLVVSQCGVGEALFWICSWVNEEADVIQRTSRNL